ncbi:MAG: adenosylcobinamide-GDP ribazoletransferase [Ignisphaera sp.]|nr:adenosylcobinamide-GDP ribazoletransferase [Ignisphaera sp.]MCX8168208.1 adenosylcobinamide-GDP ribazoletransferase [Ignisphaera sp.]MDW8084922.1 adenosylcobinamide-GDP ribazoletransferase [Ignisphaera sp.]
MSLRNIINGLKSLIALLTNIPVNANSIECAAHHFYLVPIIGAIEGIIVSLVTWVLYIIRIENVIISVLYPFFHLLVTGGIHLDGYADYSDVIGSHRTGEPAIKILKDPRKGTFAIVSTTLNLITSSTSMHLLLKLKDSTQPFPLWLILIYILSAESMYITSFFGIEEPYEGLGKKFVSSAKISTNLVKNAIVMVLTYLPVLTLIYTEIHVAFTITLVTIAASITVAIDARRRLGFVNGDVMGFSYELTRVICMVLTACI